jgi:hypothetical protein
MKALYLEERVGERDGPAQCALDPSAGPRDPARERREVRETSSTRRSRRNSIARTTTNSIDPFGVSRSRRMKERDIAGRP